MVTLEVIFQVNTLLRLRHVCLFLSFTSFCFKFHVNSFITKSTASHLRDVEINYESLRIKPNGY